MIRNRLGALLVLVVTCQSAAGTVAADQVDQVVHKRRMLGTWTVKYMEQGGRPTPEAAKNMRMQFYRHYAKLIKDSRPATSVGYYADFRNNPGNFSWTMHGRHGTIKQFGIYHLDQDTLTICLGPVGGPTPSSFQSKYDDGQTLFVMTRSSSAPDMKLSGADATLTLGVFSLAIEGETEFRSLLRLNTDREGNVQGRLFQLSTNEQVEVTGRIDKVTRRVHVTLGPDSDTTLTFDLDDVTADKIKATVEIKGRPPQTWTMTNMFSGPGTPTPGELID